MNLPGQQSPDSTLPSYDLSRSLGLQAGADIDFKKLAAQLDCTRNFYKIVTKITAARADECGQQRIGLCGELTHWDYPQSTKYRPVRTLCSRCAAIIFT